jgi:hypothetical protein
MAMRAFQEEWQEIPSKCQGWQYKQRRNGARSCKQAEWQESLDPCNFYACFRSSGSEVEFWGGLPELEMELSQWFLV